MTNASGKIAQIAKDTANVHKPALLQAGLLIEHMYNPRKERTVIQTGICSVTERFLDVCNVGCRFECHPSYIYCFLRFESYNIRVLVDALKQQLINLLDDLPVNIYYSDYLKTEEEVRLQLDYMANHLGYSLIYGYMKRFSYQFVINSEQRKEPLAPDAGLKIREFLDRKDYSGLIQYIEQQKDHIMSWDPMKKAPFSSQNVYLFMETLLYALKFHFCAGSWKSPLSDPLPVLLRSCGDIYGFFHYLETCITDYEDFIHPKTGFRKQQLMETMLLYIDQNLPTVTLGSLAEQFHLTGAYISRAFKNYTGENFSDYVADRKLYQASRMLAEDISIREISIQLGYSSPTYFLARFKEKFGLTPSAYRRKHLVYELSGGSGFSEKAPGEEKKGS